MSEDNPLPALKRMSEFDLFQFLWPDLHHKLKVDRRFAHVFTQAHKVVSWFKLLYLDEQFEPWIVYLLAIMSRGGVKEVISFCKRFGLPERMEKKLVRQKAEADRIALDMLRRPYMKPSEIYWLLKELDSEGLLYLMAIARKKNIQKAISQFVTRLGPEQSVITGEDLRNLGYKPGPLYRTMLNHVIESQLNGVIETRDQALEFIQEHYPKKISGKK